MALLKAHRICRISFRGPQGGGTYCRINHQSYINSTHLRYFATEQKRAPFTNAKFGGHTISVNALIQAIENLVNKRANVRHIEHQKGYASDTWADSTKG